jgi:nitrogen fixation NifU-like protein
MTAAADLYRTLVLEHGRHPRNVGRLAQATHAADGDNPLCGDALHVELALAGETVTALRFEGESCVLATASASLMSERVTGLSRAEAQRAIDAMEALCAGRPQPSGGGEGALGDLRAFAEVHRHPVRAGCALLPWRTLRRALGD